MKEIYEEFGDYSTPNSVYLITKQLNKTKINKKKLREWEIPMNLSNEEKKLYGITTENKLDNTAKPNKDEN